MALSGTITGSTDNQYIDAKITWSATQSIDGNYSMVTATLYYSRNNTGYTTYGTWNGKITINGTATSASKYLTITYNSNTKAISATVKVPHNSDGTKTITISASGSMPDTSLDSTSVSGSITLNTIPRASSVSMSTGTMGSASTIKITRASSSFTHTLTYKFGSKTVTIATKTSSTSVSWTPQIADFAAQIPKATYGTGTLTCTTYNGTTSVGSKSINVRLNLPSNVKPSVGALTLTPATITLLNPDNGATTTSTVSILVQNKNKLTLKASSVIAGEGSTIAYYTFSGPSYSKKVTSTSASASASISSVSNTGTLTYKVTVTDARGRTSDAVSKTITCYAYTAPSISSFSAYRADSSGNKNANGTYLKCTYTPSYSSVNNTNAATVTAYYNGSSQAGGNNSVLINLNGDTSTTYKVYLTIRDKYGGYKTTSTKTVYGEFRVLNITSDGTGVAFGKMAENKQLFDCRWNAKFGGTITSQGNILTGNNFGCNGAYNGSNFAMFCQWADGNNHDIIVRSSDGLHMGLGWVGSDTYPTSLDIRPKEVSIRGETTIQGFRVPEIQHGNVSITPSAANTPTSKIVTFDKEFSASPNIVASAHTSVPGTIVLGVGTTNRSTTGCNILVTRINTTETTVNWIAIH